MALPQPLRALRAVKPAEAGGTPPLSPERSALADAIAAHVDLQAQRTGTAAAIGVAGEAIWDARRRLDAAPELVERAKANVAQHLADVARGVAGMPPQTIREARNAVQDAQDDLDAAEASRDALRAAMERLDKQAYFVLDAVKKAALAVIGAEATATAQMLSAHLVQLQRDMLVTGRALEWLVGTAKALPVGETPGSMFGKAVDDATRYAIIRLNSHPDDWNSLKPLMAGDGAEPWRTAFAALQADATAPLPVVPAP